MYEDLINNSTHMTDENSPQDISIQIVDSAEHTSIEDENDLLTYIETKKHKPKAISLTTPNKSPNRMETDKNAFQPTNAVFKSLSDHRSLHIDSQDDLGGDFFKCDSPLSMSPVSDHGNNVSLFEQLSYHDVEKTLSQYKYSPNKYLDEFDILITYLKGQKHLYIQSKQVTQAKLTCLIIPSLIISALITIFAPLMCERQWSGITISIANASLTLIISIASYYKLESSTEMFLYMANQYDKMESSMELASNQLLFLDSELEQQNFIIEKIRYIELKTSDLKESNCILIPPIVRQMFPIISNVNIFSLIKKIKQNKKNQIIIYTDVKNEIRKIQHHWKQKNTYKNSENPTFVQQQNRVNALIRKKDIIKEEIIHGFNAYASIDKLIFYEIKESERPSTFWNLLFFGMKTKKNPNLHKLFMTMDE